MSSSSKAEGAILPTSETSVQVGGIARQDDHLSEHSISSAEQVDEILGGDPLPSMSTSSWQPGDDRPPGDDREQNDCFFKVIDVNIGGKEIVVQGECYSMDKLDLITYKFPPQRKKTVRVILDGRRAGRVSE